MYCVSIERTFSALHQLRLPNDTLEPLHGHDWGVRVEFARETLDHYGMVVDFHEAESVLERILAPLQHSNLNEQPDLSRINPSAETLARLILERIKKAGLDCVRCVHVTESPGCVASYKPLP